ncbi:hypothetical protein [Thiothrix lacustris]|nr:hypothetical protein [Thiothrix lacustris]WMP15726.1 hypothetical protein RCS87_09995 [Thiothrix lacustris]
MKTVERIRKAKADSLRRSFALYKKAKEEGRLQPIPLTEEQQKLLRPMDK